MALYLAFEGAMCQELIYNPSLTQLPSLDLPTRRGLAKSVKDSTTYERLSLSGITSSGLQEADIDGYRRDEDGVAETSLSRRYDVVDRL